MAEKITRSTSEEKDIKNPPAENAANAEAEGKKDEKPDLAESKKKKKIKRLVQKGRAHIQCTYNNIMISISDSRGEVLSWSSSGLLGFKGAKKSTPYAATQVAGDVVEKVKKYGVSEIEIYVKGVGSGREAAIRALVGRGFNVSLIKDITPMPHNGCRPKKPRRV